MDASPRVDCLHQEKDPELSIYLPIPIPLWFLSLFSLGFPLSMCILFPLCVCRRSSSSFCFLPSTPAPNGRHHVSLGRVSLSPCASLSGLTGSERSCGLPFYISCLPFWGSFPIYFIVCQETLCVSFPDRYIPLLAVALE